MKRVYGYVRISDKKQEAGVSREEQTIAIENYALKNDLEIIQWFTETCSASKRGRPMFSEIIKKLKRGSADGIIVHKVDRSARNGSDFSELMELHDLKGIIVGFAHSNIDISTRSGRLSAEMEAVFAADYSRNLREEVKKGLYGRLRQGIYPFAAPLGYLDTGKGKVKKIDTKKAPLVRELFKLYATGEYSQQMLLKLFNKKGLSNVKGNPLCKANISRMLHNPFYMGVIKIQKTGDTFIGKHTPLISEELFIKVQTRLIDKHAPKKFKHEHIFKGLIKCAKCHYTMPGTLQKGRYYFRCIQKNCKNTSNESVVNRVVQKTIDRLTIFDDIKGSILSIIQEEVRNLIEQQKHDIKALKLAENKAKIKLENLTDLLVDGVLNEENYTIKKEKINHEIVNLRSQHNEIAHNTEKIHHRANEVIELLQTAKQSYLSANTAEKRLLLKKLISNFYIDARKPLIELKTPFQDLLNQQSVSLCEQLRADTPINICDFEKGTKNCDDIKEFAKIITETAISLTDSDCA